MEGTISHKTLSSIAASKMITHCLQPADRVSGLYVAHLQKWRSGSRFNSNILAPVQVPGSVYQTEGRLWTR